MRHESEKQKPFGKGCVVVDIYGRPRLTYLEDAAQSYLDNSFIGEDSLHLTRDITENTIWWVELYHHTCNDCYEEDLQHSLRAVPIYPQKL